MSDPATSSSFRLAVLNPGGRDPFIDYARGPGRATSGVHPPINFHAYAAATRGAFFDSTKAVLARKEFQTVLVLIRRRVWISLEAVRQLKAAGRTVLVSWKESGPYQITEQLHSARALAVYQDLLALADGVVSPTAVLPPRWGWITAAEFERKTRFIPTPYPLEFEDWDYSVPIEDRDGILIGTREFFVPTRNHLRALAQSAVLADELGVPVTVINGDKRAGRKILSQLEDSFPESRLRIIERPMPYDAYLCLMASHRLVFQWDRSSVPGQVAGDALLCRTLCAGGNTAIENVVFPSLADDGSGALTEVFDEVEKLFKDDKRYRAAVDASQKIAAEQVNYGAVAKQLEVFARECREGIGY